MRLLDCSSGTTCYLLLTTYCYLLLTSYYLLLTTDYALLTYYLLLAAVGLLLRYYLLLTTFYLLLTPYYYLLLTTCCCWTAPQLCGHRAHRHSRVHGLVARLCAAAARMVGWRAACCSLRCNRGRARHGTLATACRRCGCEHGAPRGPPCYLVLTPYYLLMTPYYLLLTTYYWLLTTH